LAWQHILPVCGRKLPSCNEIYTNQKCVIVGDQPWHTITALKTRAWINCLRPS
jgi:hypothetical protein